MNMTIPFKTSSYTAANEACVEAGQAGEIVAFQDSKFKFRDEKSPVLAFSKQAFAGLRDRINSGELDL